MKDGDVTISFFTLFDTLKLLFGNRDIEYQFQNKMLVLLFSTLAATACLRVRIVT